MFPVYANEVKEFDTHSDSLLDAMEDVTIDPVLTIGESVNDYRPPGILDGLGAYDREDAVLVLVNHELRKRAGYAYTMRNGTRLKGARISSLLISKDSRAIIQAGLAYDTIYDRSGNEVTDPDQIDGAVVRLCSARAVSKGEYGFVDDLFFSGEETRNGTEYVLDVQQRKLWAAPALGHAAFESVAPVTTGDPKTIGLVIGDDTAKAPLYYYVGKKNVIGDNSFLDRNGLSAGQLYCWASNTHELTPQDFNGTGNKLSGKWVALAVQDKGRAGKWGYDKQGYLHTKTLHDKAHDAGCFSFSRPEDVHENPNNPSEVVMASTGLGKDFPEDNWGTLYSINVETAELRILLDTDDERFRDYGVRSPDNLTWSSNGMIYVQEDRATSERVPKRKRGCGGNTDCLDKAFGGRSGIDASIWMIDPGKPIKSVSDIRRLAVVNRDAIFPDGQTDDDPLDIGDWETSGIIDVTHLFETKNDETLLMGTVQAHSVDDGSIKEHDLVEGGQLFFMSIEK